MKVGSVLYRDGENILPEDKFAILYDAADVHLYDLIMLHGGDDISPTFYNQAPVHTNASAMPSRRDRNEWAIIKEAIRLGKPIFGICRGAQLLCVAAGGTLFQHVNGHARDGHDIITSNKQRMFVNSAHHQAMRLNDRGVMLACTPYQIADARFIDRTESIVTDEPEVEAAWWPDLNAVGVQAHPEWMGQQPFVQYCRSLIREYL
jgi:putative glutamine amidotransferase